MGGSGGGEHARALVGMDGNGMKGDESDGCRHGEKDKRLVGAVKRLRSGAMCATLRSNIAAEFINLIIMNYI